MNAVSIVERCIPPSLKGNPASSRSKEVLGNRVSSKLKEQPLLEYVPSSYICVLEGKLLANGDLKARNLVARSRRKTPLVVLRETIKKGLNIHSLGIETALETLQGV